MRWRTSPLLTGCESPSVAVIAQPRSLTPLLRTYERRLCTPRSRALWPYRNCSQRGIHLRLSNQPSRSSCSVALCRPAGWCRNQLASQQPELLSHLPTHRAKQPQRLLSGWLRERQLEGRG